MSVTHLDSLVRPGVTRRSVLALLACLAGCGRIAFDADVDAATAADVAVVACTSGQDLALVSAFNASPNNPANACNVGNVIGQDDQVAGLDLAGAVASECTSWGPGDNACGCVGVDLGAITAVGSVTIRAAPTPSACGTSCGGGLCGTGQTFTAYFGTVLGTYQAAAPVMLTGAALTDYPISLDRPARYLVVCRDAWSASRDDIVVDDITARCQ